MKKLKEIDLMNLGLVIILAIVVSNLVDSIIGFVYKDYPKMIVRLMIGCFNVATLIYLKNFKDSF